MRNNYPRLALIAREVPTMCPIALGRILQHVSFKICIKKQTLRITLIGNNLLDPTITANE